ncbi:DUF6503 family protein [Flagellimonas sp. HMM57]|uniref:DUF6503 family protein n=1 Tax=unclassified Flagellimonas TaxID=2644544 RepID=UPI0013D27AC4|nr:MULTISPECIES: DUF6503 family protein [unclassified Flagellimonas]UII75643.1 DUF6503 family protein [Flagellimonas sp. HMM57]
MRLLIFGLLLTLSFGYGQEPKLHGRSILEKAMTVHDSLDKWKAATLNFHIQEPRISNPHRYSILKLNNAKNTFELTRNREIHISKHIIESDGNSIVLLDGKVETDTMLIKKYRLDASRNIGYKNFYKLLYGLPMSLENRIGNVLQTSNSIFKNESCYKVEIELKDAIISKFWNVYISQADMTLKGVDIVFPGEPEKGDRIYFEGIIEVDGIKIPRIRHWHELKNDTYSGSDLVIKELMN